MATFCFAVSIFFSPWLILILNCPFVRNVRKYFFMKAGLVRSFVNSSVPTGSYHGAVGDSCPVWRGQLLQTVDSTRSPYLQHRIDSLTHDSRAFFSLFYIVSDPSEILLFTFFQLKISRVADPGSRILIFVDLGSGISRHIHHFHRGTARRCHSWSQPNRALVTRTQYHGRLHGIGPFWWISGTTAR